MNAYLQEERQRCQELASQLGREQQGSESRAAEAARLATLAQQATEELMTAREAAQAERSRAEQLLHDKAALQGRVSAAACCCRVGGGPVRGQLLRRLLSLRACRGLLLGSCARPQVSRLACGSCTGAVTCFTVCVPGRSSFDFGRALYGAPPPCWVQVEALQETLGRLDKADDVVMRLTEEKAALELALRGARAEGDAARAAAEERRECCAQAEAACEELKRQLDVTLAQREVAHAAVEGAADQLQALTDSHEGLERQLEAASAELAAAQHEAAQRGALVQHLQQRAAELEGDLRQAADQRDAAVSQLQRMEHQLSATQQEAAAQRQAAAEAAEQLAAVAPEARGLHAKVQSLQAANSSLKEDVKVGLSSVQRACDNQARRCGCDTQSLPRRPAAAAASELAC